MAQDRNKNARNKAQEDNAERLAKFAPLTEEEQKQLNERTSGILNEKRQNYIQALFDYARECVVTRKLSLKHNRLSELLHEEIKDKKEKYPGYDDEQIELQDTAAQDEMLLPLSIGELRAELQMGQVELSLIRARTGNKLKEIKSTWKMTDEEIERQINDWILGKQKIY